jgi:effector-binding domain-containing protein
MTEAVGVRPIRTPVIVELRELPAAAVRIEAPLSEFPAAVGEAFALAARAIEESGAIIAGHPFVQYVTFGERIGGLAGFPFAGSVVPTDRVIITSLPGGRAVTTTHVGPYDTLDTTWDRARAWMSEQGLICTAAPWEAYLTGPDDPGPPVTEIFWPIDS